MSIYAGAIQQGAAFANLALGGDTAETAAAYNSTFKTVSSKMAASRARNASERNISAVLQDKVMSNTKIRQQQDEAEAAARVSSALSGAKGASVEATIGQTKTNEAHALSASNKAAAQAIENSKAGVYNATMQMQSNVAVPKSSVAGNLMNALSSFEMNDLKIAEAFSADSKKDAGTLSI